MSMHTFMLIITIPDHSDSICVKGGHWDLTNLTSDYTSTGKTHKDGPFLLVDMVGYPYNLVIGDLRAVGWLMEGYSARVRGTR